MQTDSAPVLELDVASAVDKQLHLADLIGDSDWHLDVISGRLSFGVISWRVQLLGTESETSGTWLWAWANSQSQIPEHLLHAAHFMKAFGERHDIREFAVPAVPLNRISGSALAAFASDACQANAYYRCPYEGGAALVLIIDDAFPKCPDPPLQRIAAIFPQAISVLGVADHRTAFLRYLAFYGISATDSGGKINVTERGKSALTATFDEHNRLTGIKAELRPARASATAEWDEMQLRRMLGW